MRRFQTLLKQTRLWRSPYLCKLPFPPSSTPTSISFIPTLLSLSSHSQHNLSPFNYLSLFSSFSTSNHSTQDDDDDDYEAEQNIVEEWEEEDDTGPEIDDGGAGGGIVLHNVPWGERVLSIARQVLLKFDDDIKLYAFKTTPRGYIYVRLDQLSNDYGCPSMELIESYSREYKKVLEEEGSKGEIPDDLALEVSSPGAERLLRVPNDLLRFKDFPLLVSYFEESTQPNSLEKSGVFSLDSIEIESEQCVWKLADVRANRDPASKGRPMSRKRKDWRLKLPFSMIKKVTLHLDF